MTLLLPLVTKGRKHTSINGSTGEPEAQIRTLKISSNLQTQMGRILSLLWCLQAPFLKELTVPARQKYTAMSLNFTMTTKGHSDIWGEKGGQGRNRVLLFQWTWCSLRNGGLCCNWERVQYGHHVSCKSWVSINNIAALLLGKLISFIFTCWTWILPHKGSPSIHIFPILLSGIMLFCTCRLIYYPVTYRIL